MPTMEEVAQEQKEAWKAFKKENDKSVKQIEQHGTILGETKEMLEKLNKRMDENEVKMKRAWAAVDSKGEIITEEQMEKRKNFMQFLRKGENSLTPEQRKTLIVSDDTTGGFLTLPEMASEIDKDIVEISPIRAHAKVRPISGRSLLVPRRTGTFAADWISEGTSQAETKGLKYGLEEIHAHPLRALVNISMENLEDPLFDLEAELRSEFAEQFALAEGIAFVSGTGVGRPQGFNQAALNGVTSTDTAGSLALAADDIIDMQFRIKSMYWPTSIFAMNRAVIGAVRKLKDADNQYLWQPGLNGPTQMTLLGFPLVEVSDLSANVAPFVAGEVIITFGDFRRAFTIVDRITMSIIRDMFTLADQALVRFVARKRVGGQVVRAEALDLLDVKA